MKRFFLLAIVLVISLWRLSGQWSLHVNGNETYILNNDQKGHFPILWYSSSDDRGVLVGGFGVGVSYLQPIRERADFRFQANVGRSRFYDLPVVYFDINGQPLLGNIGVNTNWNLSLLGMLSLPIGKAQRWRISTGLGVRSTLLSRTNYGEAVVNGEVVDLRVKNKSIAPLIALLPLEWSYQMGRWTAATRLELGLTPSSRLSAFQQERNLWIFAEFSYQLNPE